MPRKPRSPIQVKPATRQKADIIAAYHATTMAAIIELLVDQEYARLNLPKPEEIGRLQKVS